MAEIFWLRGGGEGHRQTSRPHHVAIDEASEKLVPFEKRYFDEPPDLDPGRFAHDDDWHVFMRVNEEEVNGAFPEEGYYQLVHLTPQDCRALFDLSR